MQSIIAKIATILNWLSGTFIILMLAITVADVFGKSVLNLPFKGSLEIISYYCMIGSVFLALPYVTLKREHISSDIVYTNLSQRKKEVMNAFALLVCLFFFGLFAYYMSIEAYRSFVIREEAFGSVFIPIWPSKLMMPIGLILSAMVILVSLGRRFKGIESFADEE